MAKDEDVKPSFSAEAFAGTADYYVRYRVPYPERLLQDLVTRVGVSGEGRLLDLACGPGRLTLPLAPSFREVWAVDLEPEMIEAARKEAARQGVNHVTWKVGRAEDLEAPAAGFELVTIGDALLRLDQPRVARQTLRWLTPGGCLAILGSDSIFQEKESWQRTVGDVIRRWARRGPAAGGPAMGLQPASGPDHNQRVLREAGFEEVGTYPSIEPHDWTVEAIVGYLYSTSVCSRRVLGAAAPAFETDLRAALLAHDPGGVYREDSLWGYTIGRKPQSR